MFGLGLYAQRQKCGVVIDIGSGSVGAAIVFSDIDIPQPEILWSHREYVLIKDLSSDTDVPLKEITTSLINIFLQLGSEGMKALHRKDKKIDITAIQVTISAPWAYTITKTINFTDEHPFEVNQEFIDDLSNTAEKKAFRAVAENKIFEINQLEIIDNKTTGIIINGYPIDKPKHVTTRTISLAHITAITQKKILTVLEDSKNKILPQATLSTHSFMYIYYDVLKHMKPDTSEICLIDITSEATEIGIVRDGILTHVAHIPLGTFSIAREISATCKVPKEEAYTYLKGATSLMEEKLTKEKLEELTSIIDSYEDEIALLFKTTGDILSIPKTLFVHCETSTEEFFRKHTAAAAKKATKINHSVHPITSLLFKEPKNKDTALLLSANYLHNIFTQKIEKDI